MRLQLFSNSRYILALILAPPSSQQSSTAVGILALAGQILSPQNLNNAYAAVPCRTPGGSEPPNSLSCYRRAGRPSQISTESEGGGGLTRVFTAGWIAPPSHSQKPEKGAFICSPGHLRLSD